MLDCPLCPVAVLAASSGSLSFEKPEMESVPPVAVESPQPASEALGEAVMELIPGSDGESVLPLKPSVTFGVKSERSVLDAIVSTSVLIVCASARRGLKRPSTITRKTPARYIKVHDTMML